MKLRHSALFLLGAVLLVLLTRRLAPAPADGGQYRRAEGTTFHTVYHITYAAPPDSDAGAWHDSIRTLFAQVDASLSMFNPASTISRVNAPDTCFTICDTHFRQVFDKGRQVSLRTDGAFDMTIAPLVNLWGFGFKNRGRADADTIDALLNYVGWRKVGFRSDSVFYKLHAQTVLDASSIAKGYACDVAARFLERHGCHDYIVEVGGEIAVSGTNAQGAPWSIGINKPVDDSLQVADRLENVLHLTSGGVATSGNYRNYYYADGRRYAHTIDPATGCPVQQDILSATVVAPDCMTADAYATAFMVMGSQRALRIVEADTTLMAYFILAADAGNGAPYRAVYSPSMARLLSRP